VVDFVEICNVYTRKAIIKASNRIFNSDKICRSYCDFYFGVTFLEHGVHCKFVHIGVAKILSGVHFFLPKIRPFLVVALKYRLNIPQNLTRPAKTVLKLTLALAGVHFVSWRCTYTFSL